MAVTPNDLIIIPITEQMNNLAEFIATKRQLFEYPRKGYGDYDSRGNSKIKAGMLGELAFLEFMHSELQKKYGSLPAKERWEILHKKVEFSYQLVIGKFDKGYEFSIGKKTIDIKTYQNKTVSVEQIFKGLNLQGTPLHLFIDQSQKSIAEIYIQTFILHDNKVCLAGYYQGLPPLQTWMPNRAYSKPIPELNPMASLLIDL
jgi:hypothetical protein